MSIKSILRASFACACLIYATTSASADMLLSYESGSTGNLSSPGMAIDFTSGSYSVTSFNWLTGSTPGSETPTAFGTLYIIQTTSSALNAGGYDSGISPNSNGTLSSPLPPGDTVIASAVASGNTYSFSPGVTLNAGTVYYFFTAGGTPDENASGNPSPPVTLRDEKEAMSSVACLA